MKNKSKRGFEMSFSMIFSIIVIIGILATAFYVISYFLSLKNCTELGLFSRDLQDTIDRAWNSDSSNEVFDDSLPGFVDKVCIGNLADATKLKEYDELIRFKSEDANLFFYPPTSCDIKYRKLEHVQISQFSCIPVDNGRIEIRVRKSFEDNLVSISP